MKTFFLTIVFAALCCTSCSIKADTPESLVIQKNSDTVVSSEEYKQTQLELKRYREREAEHKKSMLELEERKLYFRQNWEDFIKIIDPGATVNHTWGGINNLHYTVMNKSNFKIDKIELVVNYIKANGGIYKTEIVTIEDIVKKEKRIFYAPNSDRGVEYNMTINMISSKAANFCYMEISNAKQMNQDENDPYKCLGNE